MGFLGRGSRTEKIQMTYLSPLQGVCAERFLPSVSFHFRKNLSRHLPPFVCAQLPGQRLQMGSVYLAAVVRLRNSRHAASPLLGIASDTAYPSATFPKCDLLKSAFIAHPLTINLPGIVCPYCSYGTEYVSYIQTVHFIFCSYKKYMYLLNSM